MSNDEERCSCIFNYRILESGKTQFLDFTIHQSYFQIPDKTLLILCEEGEEEYDEESLKKMNTVIEIIEDPEDFNADTLQMLNKNISLAESW